MIKKYIDWILFTICFSVFAYVGSAKAQPFGTSNRTFWFNVDVDATMNFLTQNEVRYQDASGGEYVSIKAPATISTSFDLILPNDDGNASQVLETDGNGNLDWVDQSGLGFTASNDNRLVRTDTVGGNEIQESGITVDDTDVISNVTAISLIGTSLINVTEIVDPSTPASNLVRIYASSTTKRLRTIDDAGTVVDYAEAGSNSTVRLHTGNGQGSTNTAIRRFTTAVENVGSDITYTDSATDGASFEVNRDGVYCVSYSDERTSSGTVTYGISLNSAQLTTNIESITAADRLAHSRTPGIAEADNVAWCGFLSDNDIVRPHENGNANAGATATFTITQVRAL